MICGPKMMKAAPTRPSTIALYFAAVQTDSSARPGFFAHFLVGYGQGPQRLGDDLPGVGKRRQFAAPRTDHLAVYEHDVAQIDVGLPGIQRLLPDPDQVIRTGGEQRISNFLIWQSAYAELVFTECLWPDFGPGEFDHALLEFASRTRRFGR